MTLLSLLHPGYYPATTRLLPGYKRLKWIRGGYATGHAHQPEAASDLVSGVFGATKWIYPPHNHPRKTRHLAVGFYLLPAYSQSTPNLLPIY